jgi:hypothetical protein
MKMGMAAEFRAAHASHVLVIESSRSQTSLDAGHDKSVLRRDAATNTRDACATQSGGSRISRN